METRHQRGVDVVAINVTAATVSKLGVTSSRPAFEEMRGKERERERKRDERGEREIETSHRERERES